MRAPRIFVDAKLDNDVEINLDEAASRHLAKALRRQAGDSVVLFNGDGRDYQGLIERIDRRNVQVRIQQSYAVDCESPLVVHLGIGMSRTQKLDLVLQKAAELGANHITPLICERSVLRLDGEKSEKRLLHWQGILRSACEQCGRARIPSLSLPAPINEWLKQVDTEQKLLLDPEGQQIPDLKPTPRSVAMVHGPEGGFSLEERQRAMGCGFTPVRMGPRILRTETAPLTALSIVQHRWGDLR